MVEIYTDTGWYVPQPFGDPLDLSLADSELIAINDERLRQVPGAKPLAEWVEEIGRRIEEAQV
jgi:catechol 2,3-dioxygenase